MKPPLTSAKNPRVREVIKLRERRPRERAGRFIIEGFREITRAVASGLPIETLFVCPELFLGANEAPLIESARARSNAEVVAVSPHVFEKMAYRDRPEGLLAVAPQPEWTLARLAAPTRADPLYLVACAIEKPGNLGSLLRSADAAGCDGVIVCDRCTDPFNPNVVRASIGTLFTVPVAEGSGDEARAWLRARGVRVVATTPAAPASLWDTDLTGPIAIAVGSEQLGLDATWLEAADLRVRIPMRGNADSLNAAAAATVVLFEACRQRPR